MFKETADIQTADMLNLPVPEAHYHNIVLKPSEAQKKMVEGLSDRAERVRNKMVDSSNLSSEENAAKEFMEVKHRYGKEDGRVCYHGHQSFKADEVDADTAHNIGVALAKELWGDRFQVVIATHCNTGH